MNCNKITNKWYTEWPKRSTIIWICKKCKEIRDKDNKNNLEDMLVNFNM